MAIVAGLVPDYLAGAQRAEIGGQRPAAGHDRDDIRHRDSQYREDPFSQPVFARGEGKAQRPAPQEPGKAGNQHGPERDRQVVRAGQPGGRKPQQHRIDHQQQIGCRQDQRGQRSAPVAQRHPQVDRGAAPAHPVPSLEGDPVDPAGLLPNRRFDRAGEIGSGRNQVSGIVAQPQEGAAAPFLRQDQAQLVILGQAFGSEGSGFALGAAARGQFAQRRAGKAATHPGCWQRSAKCGAHHHPLGVAFGEFVGIMASDPARLRLRFGAHRQLHEIAQHQRRVDRLERGGMYHVLGIVQHNAGKGAARAGLVRFQRAVQAIEAIGLGGRPVGTVDHDPHPRIAPGRSAGRRQGGGIVAIATDIDHQIALRPGRQHVRQCRAYHRRFLEGGDQHCGPARQWLCAIADRQPRGAPPTGQAQPQPGQVNRELVDQADAQPEGGKGQQLVLEQHQRFKPGLPRHGPEHALPIAPWPLCEWPAYRQWIVVATRTWCRRANSGGAILRRSTKYCRI